MQWSKIPNDVILHIFTFNDFKDKCLKINLLNKECNKIINNDLPHFNEWLSKFFDYNARCLYITNWLKEEKSVPITPLIHVIDGKKFCIFIDDYFTNDLENAARNNNKYLDIFQILNNKYGPVWGYVNDRLKVPSWKHFLFQKEIVELWFSEINIPLDHPDTGKIPVGLFEFVEIIVEQDGETFVRYINQQKRGIALSKFISSSKHVRERMKKIDIGPDKDYKSLAYEYAMNIAMQTYHLKSQII
jgi:hypothetical protein